MRGGKGRGGEPWAVPRRIEEGRGAPLHNHGPDGRLAPREGG